MVGHATPRGETEDEKKKKRESRFVSSETRANVVLRRRGRVYGMVSDPNISGGFSALRREVITVKSGFISHATSPKSATIKTPTTAGLFQTKGPGTQVSAKCTNYIFILSFTHTQACSFFLSLCCEDEAH